MGKDEIEAEKPNMGLPAIGSPFSQDDQAAKLHSLKPICTEDLHIWEIIGTYSTKG